MPRDRPVAPRPAQPHILNGLELRANWRRREEWNLWCFVTRRCSEPRESAGNEPLPTGRSPGLDRSARGRRQGLLAFSRLSRCERGLLANLKELAGLQRERRMIDGDATAWWDRFAAPPGSGLARWPRNDYSSLAPARSDQPICGRWGSGSVPWRNANRKSTTALDAPT